MASRKNSGVESIAETLPDFSLLDEEDREKVRAVLQRQMDVERRLLDVAHADRCANSLEQFVKEGWSILYGQRPLQWNWHLSVGCELLMAMRDGELHRLLFNWPPRTLKSNIVSVFYPPFMWTKFPEHQFLTVSHKSGLAQRDSIRSRRLILSDWYMNYWGKLFYFTSDQNKSERYVNSVGGHRIAQGILSAAIGEDADTVLIDDPHDPKKMFAEKQREKVNDEIWPDLQLRLNDQMSGNIIVMMQRIHENDLSGHILETDALKEFKHVCFPLEFEKDHENKCIYDIRTKEGELLMPGRFPKKYVEALKSRTNAFIYAGRFQQRPSLKGGNILMRDWWQVWTEPDLPSVEIIIVSVDTAFKEGATNDFSACTVWGLWKPNPKAKKYNMILMGSWNERLRYGDCKAKIVATIKKWTIDDIEPDHVIIEDKASGQSIIQDFQDAGIPCFAYNPGRESLVMRANVVSDLLEDGQIWVPGKPMPDGGRSDKILVSWAERVVDQCQKFPKTDHDDMVVTAVQCWHFASDQGYIEGVLDLPLPESDPMDSQNQVRESFYG